MYKSLPEALATIEKLRNQLREIGIPEDKISPVLAMLNEYTEATSEITKLRSRQFRGDAYLTCADLKIAQTKNIDALGEYLRRFAEHVTTHVLSIITEASMPIADIVDHIPPMIAGEENAIKESMEK